MKIIYIRVCSEPFLQFLPILLCRFTNCSSSLLLARKSPFSHYETMCFPCPLHSGILISRCCELPEDASKPYDSIETQCQWESNTQEPRCNKLSNENPEDGSKSYTEEQWKSTDRVHKNTNIQNVENISHADNRDNQQPEAKTTDFRSYICQTSKIVTSASNDGC